MTLEAIYFASQVAAAVALVASLIFVGLQIRLVSQTNGLPFFDNVLATLSSPAAREWWSQRKTAFEPGFVEFIDERLEDSRTLGSYAFFRDHSDNQPEETTSEETP